MLDRVKYKSGWLWNLQRNFKYNLHNRVLNRFFIYSYLYIFYLFIYLNTTAW